MGGAGMGGAVGGEKGWHGAGGRTRQSTRGVLRAAAQAQARAGCGTLTLKPRPGTRRAVIDTLKFVDTDKSDQSVGELVAVDIDI
jgi:hypothetical protein